MSRVKNNKFIEDTKKKYFQIGSISCPAFCGEKVYFNRHGWNHLIRKGRKFRETRDQIRRIKLLPRALHILRHTKSIRKYRITKIGLSVAYFWELEQVIHVIVRKVNNGRLHLFSIF